MAERKPIADQMAGLGGPNRRRTALSLAQTDLAGADTETVEPSATPTPAPTPPSHPVTPEQRPRDTKAAPTKPRGRVGRPRKSVDGAEPTGIFTSTLSLPVDLTDRLKAWAHGQRVTYAQAVMSAIEAHYDELDELVAALQPTEVSGRLFTVTEKAEQEPRTSVTFNMENRNLAVLDQLVDQVGADNRSELCIAALDAYLPAAE